MITIRWFVVVFVMFLLGCSPDPIPLVKLDKAQIDSVSKVFVQAMVNGDFSEAYSLTSRRYKNINSVVSMQKEFDDYFFSSNNVAIHESEIGLPSFEESHNVENSIVGFTITEISVAYLYGRGSDELASPELMVLDIAAEYGEAAIDGVAYMKP